MRRMNIVQWTAKDEKGNDIKEDITTAITVLISIKKPEEMPKGFEQFKTFSRIINSFTKAIDTKILELEEKEYIFIKKIIENDLPIIWAGNKDLKNSIDEFMNLKEE